MTGILDPMPDSGGLSSVRGAIHHLPPETRKRRRNERGPSAERDEAAIVAEARSILAGGSIAIAGGDQRPGAAGAIRESLGLRSVEWATTSERKVARLQFRKEPDLRCVVALIRLIRHHTHDMVQSWCRETGIPLVTVTGGYGPNNIARAIVERMR